MGVKYGLNTTSGAPSLSGQAGALIVLLDAYLINGFSGYTPPPGWIKEFTGTNKAVYRSTALGASGLYLRVNDTTTTYATLTGYESMSDVDTGTAAWGTVYWQKSSTADAVERPYAFACDEMFAIFAPAWVANSSIASLNCFGDFISDIAGDGYKCYLAGNHTAGGVDAWSNNFSYSIVNPASTQNGNYVARNYTLLSDGGAAAGKIGIGGAQNIGAAGFSTTPSVANGDKYVFPIKLGESVAFRGTLPGIYQPLHSTSIAQWSTFTGVAGLAERTWMNVNLVSTTSNHCWIDVTGPWR